MNQVAKTRPGRIKHCPDCDTDLPIENFTSSKARRCNSCKRLRDLNLLQARQLRAIEKLKTRKPRVKSVEKVSDLKKTVQRAVNKYVRERDENEPCMACQKPCKDGGDASHYVAQGSSGFLRYNTDNIWKCCTACNRYKHGNLIDFRVNLVKKIGEDRVKWLEDHRKDVKRWSREELLEILEEIKQKHLLLVGGKEI